MKFLANNKMLLYFSKIAHRVLPLHLKWTEDMGLVCDMREVGVAEISQEGGLGDCGKGSQVKVLGFAKLILFPHIIVFLFLG